MAQPPTQQYHLRKRNLSQAGINLSGDDTNSTLSVIHEETQEKTPRGILGDRGTSDPDLPILEHTEKVSLEIPVINMEDFAVVDMNDKLNLLMSAINKINTTFHLKFKELSDTVTSEQVSTTAKIANLESLLQETQARVDDLEGKVLPDDVVDRVGKLEQENAQLRDELAIVKGLMQVQERRILSNKDKITDLTTRSMANNILIAGLVEGTTQETAKICKDKVLTLLCEKMKMEVKDKEVVVAHRLGKPGLKPRTMVVRCAQGLRDTIFQYTKNLKDVKNEVGDYYYVSVQLPELLAAEKREREELIKKDKKQNAEVPDQDKHKRKEIVVKNKTVYVDKVPQKTHIFPPHSARYI